MRASRAKCPNMNGVWDTISTLGLLGLCHAKLVLQIDIETDNKGIRNNRGFHKELESQAQRLG